ncbi:response regulator [Ramlibacter sp. AN1015]|uniref:response regulator n=1 Tax=Ramlibacter sp. AN1015 TaxID=3133428 RepID=UPI0030BB2258
MVLDVPPSAAPLPRILVVDDSPDSLWLMSQLLEGRYHVLQAASGQEALCLAATEPAPDLLLLDIVMPDMDGYEVLRRLRQQPRTASIPVAFMTSLSEREQVVLGRELGAVDYLTKPVDVREVIARVEAHVSQRQHARRMEVLGERLARHLSPGQWEDLFHGARAPSIRFAHQPLMLLLVQSAALNGSTSEREAFRGELALLALQFGGELDRFERESTVLLFDEPASALKALRAMQQRHDPRGLRLALHDMQAEVARFEGPGGLERTLVGGEAERVRQAAEEARGGVVAISPAAYAALRDELAQSHPGEVFTARYTGPAIDSGKLSAM